MDRELGAIEEGDWEEHGGVHAVCPDTHSHRCKGYGRVATERPSSPSVEKGGNGGSKGERGQRAGSAEKGWSHPRAPAQGKVEFLGQGVSRGAGSAEELGKHNVSVGNFAMWGIA